jgi:hypothetical protein
MKLYKNYNTSLNKSLENPSSLLWAENAEFIVDEYYREKDCKNSG